MKEKLGKFHYEAEYEDGGISIGAFEPPPEAYEKDVFRVLIQRNGTAPIDIRLHEGEAMDIAIGLLYTLRVLNPRVAQVIE